MVGNVTSVQQPPQRLQQVSIQQPPAPQPVSVQQHHDYHMPATAQPAPQTSFTIVEAQGTQPRLGQPATTTQLIPNATHPSTPATEPNANNKFVLSSEYISQTIRKALKQDNLNPELEEKLLQQLKYHEKILKEGGGNGGSSELTPATTAETVLPPQATYARPPPPGYRKRPANESVETTPVKKSREDDGHAKKSPGPRVPRVVNRNLDDKRKLAEAKLNAKLLVTLNKHKELLKKDMLRKRSLLEKDLLFCIQRDIAKELSSLRQVNQVQEEPDIQRAPVVAQGAHVGPTGSSKRKSAATPTTTIQATPGRGRGRGRGRGTQHRYVRCALTTI